VPGRIPEEVIAEVRERTDIVQIIGQHVQLKRAGTNHKGLCPFHDEKTPSFNVNPQRQFYHCFGCQESGDVFSFLMKIEGRSFMEVVEDLAGRIGVEIPREQVSPAQARAAAQRRSERQQGLDLNQRVAKLYEALLWGTPGAAARDYLQQRGLGEEVARTFRLGFAPQSGSAVVRALEKAEIDLPFAERLGLVAKRTGRQGYHDRFWDRLIFPVVGAGSEVLGFGGRKLGDGDGPKYINTPETTIYRKGEALYGLEAAAKAMRQGGRALVVEGNVDVIQLHQHDFRDAVAPMGTALTPRQVLLLGRFSKEVVALFDGDDAGRAAALKSIPTLLEGRVTARIATLPMGHDPDSFLREEGPQALQQLVGRAIPAVEFMINTLRAGIDGSIPDRARVLEQVAPIVATIESQAERDLYAGKLALDLAIAPSTVQRAIRGQLSKGSLQQEIRSARPKRPQTLKLVSVELDLLGILVDHPHLAPRAEEAGIISLLTNDGLRATYRAATEMQQASGQIDPVALLEAAPDEVREAVAKVVMSEAFRAINDPTRALDDCLNKLKRNQLEGERKEIKSKMVQAKSDGDAQSELRLATRMIEVEREIHETR
jgi:DNA primase